MPELRVDIKNIQLSDNERIFNKSVELFLLKWSKANGQVDHFLVYLKKNFVDSKSGWYEGYSSGDPSQSNGIESSHKHFKCFENIKERTPCIKFMKGKGRRLVEEWSLQRSSTYTQTDGTVIDNPNVKIYKTKPDILTADWSHALKWDGKKHKIIHLFQGSNVYCTSDIHKTLNRADCREHLKYLENIEIETSFERLINKVTDIRVIHLNEVEWENSRCSCRWWHKNLKCNHIIALACRIKLASYIAVAYSAPLTAKRRTGRPKITTTCLRRQPTDHQDDGQLVEMCTDDDSDDDIPISVLVQTQPQIASKPPPKKRGRKRKDESTVTAINDNPVSEKEPERRSKRLKK